MTRTRCVRLVPPASHVTIVPRVAVYDWQRDPELAVDDCAPHGMARPDTTEAAS